MVRMSGGLKTLEMDRNLSPLATMTMMSSSTCLSFMETMLLMTTSYQLEELTTQVDQGEKDKLVTSSSTDIKWLNYVIESKINNK